MAQIAAALVRDPEDLVFLDVDSLLRRVYERQKQGVGLGHANGGSMVRGDSKATPPDARC